MDPFLQPGVDNENISFSARPDPNPSDYAGQSSASIRNNVINEVEPPSLPGRDFTVEGQRKDINTIFLKLRIADSTGQIRNIHFPFDIEADTSISVATEMVAELDLTDQDVTAIAAMIDAEIQAHVPEWVPGEGLDDYRANATVGSDTHGSEAEDELGALPNEADQSPGPLVLERLPSGRRYWSDSPKGSSGGSPSPHTQSNWSSDLNSHASDEFPPEVYEKLEDQPKHIDPKLNKSDEDNQFVGASPSHKEMRGHAKLACNPNEAASNEHEAEEEKFQDRSSSVGETDDLESIVHKLEELFVEQQNEINELKRKHSMARAQLLQRVPPELRIKNFNMCPLKFPDYSELDKSGVE